MQQATDFLAETEALYAVVKDLDATRLRWVTQFKGWTIEDVLLHLHFWNGMVDLSLTSASEFTALAEELGPGLLAGQFRELEDARVPERGPDLVAAWIARVRDMIPNWTQADPKTRLPWVGPSMSARSAMTARQMETWAHGFEVFDRLGLTRAEDDRIRNVVVLGVNTFTWSHHVQNLQPPPGLPALHLLAPSGAEWRFGDPAFGTVRGPAVDFAAVVTQTRALDDTALVLDGSIAETWLRNAQCFAGAKSPPPPPGHRRRMVS